MNDLIIRDGILFECEDPAGDIVIPQGVVAIADRAFYKANAVSSVYIPDGVRVIGEEAFLFCANLKSIRIPATVTRIGARALSCCGLTAVELPPRLTRISEELFEGTRLASITLPDGVKRIGRQAFYSCSYLEEVRLPPKLDSIGESAFYDCGHLKRINVDAAVKVDRHAFGMCEGLADENGFVIVNGTLYESPAMFRSSTVQIPEGVEYLDVATPAYDSDRVGRDRDGRAIYDFCKRLTVPRSVKGYAAYGVFAWPKLEEVVIRSKARIPCDCFGGCKRLKRLILPQGIDMHEMIFSINAAENAQRLAQVRITYTKDTTEE